MCCSILVEGKRIDDADGSAAVNSCVPYSPQISVTDGHSHVPCALPITILYFEIADVSDPLSCFLPHDWSNQAAHQCINASQPNLTNHEDFLYPFPLPHIFSLELREYPPALKQPSLYKKISSLNLRCRQNFISRYRMMI